MVAHRAAEHLWGRQGLSSSEQMLGTPPWCFHVVFHFRNAGTIYEHYNSLLITCLCFLGLLSSYLLLEALLVTWDSL